MLGAPFIAHSVIGVPASFAGAEQMGGIFVNFLSPALGCRSAAAPAEMLIVEVCYF